MGEDEAIELEKLRRKCEESERDAHKELQAWTEHTDKEGQKFYYNRDQQRSVWTDPRPARCHALYLQMKALRVLSKNCGQLPELREPELQSSRQMKERLLSLGRSTEDEQQHRVD